MATHSHFMVSDLKNESSSLIELKSKSNELVISKNINESVYGRSAEDILYEVFNMPTSRNYYIGKDLDEILQAISLNRVNDGIRDKAHKLYSMIDYLKESDPLKELIMVVYKKVTDIV
ncbi:hypothetical protein HXV90_18440 [Lysinibacillus sp. JK80]|uniref:hypothetical protein n=1 Tax=Lysinibacillus sp. JK80 TaxID=2749809 RepID=UPI0022B9791E|nr:hypothetical protein [Lysinibacillus sp. JK80]WBF57658.1 hypothetical protein HXV90_18440 [Lysinibacillus sp. JK80]